MLFFEGIAYVVRGMARGVQRRKCPSGADDASTVAYLVIGLEIMIGTFLDVAAGPRAARSVRAKPIGRSARRFL